ncbi:MAG: DUF1579 domain-containing protein [Proteobacteria bacterium]|nr:DUF1579 domain-containing protein [Pseudomonadota bacterium]
MGGGHETMHDFDFLIGNWDVRHRKLRKRLARDTRWDEFGGTMRARPLLAGHGNFDENVIDLPDGSYHACTLRLHDPATGRWTIHWIDGRDPKLDPPMTGSFAGGNGTFHGDDNFEGRPIRVRFLWTPPGDAGPRWEQAFSDDGGANWETNWIMDFVKA